MTRCSSACERTANLGQGGLQASDWQASAWEAQGFVALHFEKWNVRQTGSGRNAGGGRGRLMLFGPTSRNRWVVRETVKELGSNGRFVLSWEVRRFYLTSFSCCSFKARFFWLLILCRRNKSIAHYTVVHLIESCFYALFSHPLFRGDIRKNG